MLFELTEIDIPKDSIKLHHLNENPYFIHLLNLQKLEDQNDLSIKEFFLSETCDKIVNNDLIK